MPDHELRRKIALLKGMKECKWHSAQAPHWSMGPMAGPDDNCTHNDDGGIGCFDMAFIDYIKWWECDLNSAGELWAEMADYGTELSSESAHFTYGLMPYYESVGVSKEECPDAAERLARLIALIWVQSNDPVAKSARRKKLGME